MPKILYAVYEYTTRTVGLHTHPMGEHILGVCVLTSIGGVPPPISGVNNSLAFTPCEGRRCSAGKAVPSNSAGSE